MATTQSYTVAGTLRDDVFVPSANNLYQGGGGSDTYIITPFTLSSAVTAKIVDTEGTNVIQLVDGMTIASSTFYKTALQLTLSTGAIVQILGADKFSFQVGANVTSGDTATSQTYAELAATLGASVPTGSTPVSGTANFVVPSSGGGSTNAFTVVDLGSSAVTATSAAEEFRYDFSIVNGRATKASDGEVTITGFDVSKDKLVFVNVTDQTTYTEAQFMALAGVTIAGDPFGNTTSIYLDPNAGVAGGVTLAGIQDASLTQIVLETKTSGGGSTTTATYAVAAHAASHDEGASATFMVTTTNVANGTVLNYTLSGTGITTADVTGGALSGTVTINNGTGTISVPLAADLTTEGDETLTVTINGKTASTTIKDTSVASGVKSVDLSTGTVAATADAENFVYDYKMVNGRPTKAGDGEVTITGFDVAKDKLVFNDVGTGTVYTKAQFLALAGVVAGDDPFSGKASIYFDPDAGVLGGVTLTGVAVSSIAIETTA